MVRPNKLSIPTLGYGVFFALCVSTAAILARDQRDPNPIASSIAIGCSLLFVALLARKVSWLPIVTVPTFCLLATLGFPAWAIAIDVVVLVAVRRDFATFANLVGFICVVALISVGAVWPAAGAAIALVILRTRLATGLFTFDSIFLLSTACLISVQGSALPIAFSAGFTVLSAAVAWLRVAAVQAERQSTQEVIRLYLGTLDRSHPYTMGHASRVGQLAGQVGRSLGLSRSECRDLEVAAALHDVGKVSIDEEILDLPRRLTENEMNHVRLHAAAGGDVLEPIAGFSKISHWIRCHHERTDGQGYPAGLIGRQVPLQSRIIAVIDAFDAMTGGDAEHERRTYREPMQTAAAIAELRRCSGSQFDERVVQAFVGVVSGAKS